MLELNKYTFTHYKLMFKRYKEPLKRLKEMPAGY